MKARPGRARLWLPASVILFAAAAFGLLRFDGFHNDQFMHLAWTDEVLRGALPYRDFADPGMPLTYLLSGLARHLVGPPLLAEALLSMAALALGAALVFVTAARVSGSQALALLAAAVPVLIAPRLYSYPKILLFAWAAWALLRYGERPDRRRLAGLVLCVGVAFLVRHDHGVYIGLAALVLVAVAGRRQGRAWAGAGRLGAATAAVLLPYLIYVTANGGFATYLEQGVRFSRSERARTHLQKWPRIRTGEHTPPLPRVAVRWTPGTDDTARQSIEDRHGLVVPGQVSERTWRYGLRDSSPENIRRLIDVPEVEDTHGLDRGAARLTGDQPWLPGLARALADVGWPRVAGLFRRDNAVAWLFYLAWVIPGLAAASLLWQRRRAIQAPAERSHAGIASLILLCLMTNYGFLRDSLDARLGDVAVLPPILAVWLVAQLRQAASGPGPPPGRRVGRVALRTGLLVGLATTLLGVIAVGDTDRALARSGVLRGPSAVHARARRVVEALSVQPRIAAWDRGADYDALRRLTRYVRECTDPTDNLLLTWFAPQVYFYAERPFAAGLAFFYPGFFTADAEQRLALERWQRQSVPVVLAEKRRLQEFFVVEYDQLARYLTSQYVLAGEVPGEAGASFLVYVDGRRTPVRTWAPLGLPCFV